MPEPNFLILGAPRSATTFLYRAVMEHPRIFMSSVKEPGFFSRSGEQLPWVANRRPAHGETWEDYRALFDRSDGYPVRGEASTVYLASPVAPEAIRTRLARPPFMVAVLRQPVERAYSHYVYHRMLGTEPAATFEEAVADEPRRIRERWPLVFRYVETGRYADQVARYLDTFGRDRLLIFLMEDFRDQDAVLRQTFEFVGVDPEVSVGLSGRVNESGVSKGGTASWILKSRNPFTHFARRVLPAPVRKLLRGRLTAPAPPLKPGTRASLMADYRSDILRTGELIGRDLSSWLT